MNAWEAIFRQSRVNDGYYDEDKLPQLKWDWPRGTWFQERLDHIRERHQTVAANPGRMFPPANELSARSFADSGRETFFGNDASNH